MAIQIEMEYRSGSPPTQRRIYDFDDNIGLIFDLGNRTVLNRYLVRLLENHRFHCIFRHRHFVFATSCYDLSSTTIGGQYKESILNGYAILKFSISLL